VSTGSFPAVHSSNTEPEEILDIESQFENIRTFYSHQLSEATSAAPGLSISDLGISSPSSLARLMNFYNVGSLGPSKKGLGNSRSRARLGTFREALDTEEGLQVAQLDESASISALKSSALSDLTTTTQRLSQTESHLSNLVSPTLHGSSRLASTLRPIPVLLRTKRSKRCPVCRHIISKPEPKVASTRFRIRLVAGSYIPAITIRPLRVPGVTPPPAPDGLLRPLVPVQYLLTFTNPLFEPVKVTLATSSTTPGRLASKVTVLCPQFEIDANTDVWDEALKSDTSETSRRRDEGSKAGGVAEVGKIWERGRNWVSIVVEVVPALIKLEGDEELREDEDVLEIPMFIRIEWEVDATGAEVGAPPTAGKEVREKRELAYWSALGIGRIGSLGQLG
jgi:dynactin-4